MNYKAQKVFILAFCSIFMVIGAVAMLVSLPQFSLFGIVWGAGFFFIPLLVMRGRLRQISLFSTQTYDWYKATHPAQVQGNRLSCFACGNSRIQARALMNRTFHREHFCTQCGKTLYYSPEQS
ncbi:MAG: ABC transporter ATP-binding protein [Burkholderiales bacterium]|nr:ABC transporter ATP-binding protein [Burkholderiales bacterium]